MFEVNCQHLHNQCSAVEGFTPLCLTWAALIVTDLSRLHSGVHRRCGPTRCEIERVGMNLVVIEEHQVGDLVFAQLYYLYILLEATSAHVIVPIAKVPRTQYHS